MDTENILKHLTIDDLPADLKTVAKAKGLDAVKKFLDIFEGCSIYLHTLRFMEPVLLKYIKERIEKQPDLEPVDIYKDINRNIRQTKRLIAEAKNEIKIVKN